jgi:hypothetical protein
LPTPSKNRFADALLAVEGLVPSQSASADSRTARLSAKLVATPSIEARD